MSKVKYSGFEKGEIVNHERWILETDGIKSTGYSKSTLYRLY